MVQIPSAQNALDPAGANAVAVERMWWFLLAISTVVFLAVGVAALLAARRRSAEVEEAGPGIPIEGDEARKLTRWVAASVAATAAVLFSFLFIDLLTSRSLAAVERTEDPLTIEITGYQWWWQVEYQHPEPSQQLTTANEIHIPLGRPVRLQLKAGDVIHSFWVPNLAGKVDMIPGHTSTHWLEAEHPGEFRGQCAEFCGHQHALMGLVLIAETPENFRAWYEGQLTPATPPADSLQARGQLVFMSTSCPMCHSIQGTPAGGKVAPDLTHFGSRRGIGAATLTNTPEHLADWISDPHESKPGVKMPPNHLATADLAALVSYLRSLE